MKALSSTAMILAAGEGKRLRPLTLTKPKPLFEVGGRTMLDQVIDKLVEQKIERIVVNACYLADQIEDHLSRRKDVEIIVSHETELLDSGGGIKNVLPLFGDKPFITINADLPWHEEGAPALQRMADFWNSEIMDALLLVMLHAKARGFGAKGDFDLDEKGLLHRAGLAHKPYVFLGAQIIKPAFYEKETRRIFSNNDLWNEMEKNGRLYGFCHVGACHHVGTPHDLDEANRLLSEGAGWHKA